MTTRNPLSQTSGLTDAIAHLREQFSSMQRELDVLREENERLRGQLEATRFERRQLAGVNLRALRRRVAVYCHPDRGGNNEVMCDLNVVFDALEATPSRQGTLRRAA